MMVATVVDLNEYVIIASAMSLNEYMIFVIPLILNDCDDRTCDDSKFVNLVVVDKYMYIRSS